MSSAVVVLRRRGRGTITLTAAAADRRARRTVCVAWGLLVLNVLTYFPHQSVLPIPSSIGKVITQGSLQLALIAALSVNRKLLIRPNVCLSILSVLFFAAVMSGWQSLHFGTIYRTTRLAEFIATLWLLTPWWGRRDMLILRCHLWTMGITVGSVILGLIVSPGLALPGGRLSGAIWPIYSTQVAHYAAVICGLMIILWLGDRVRGKATLIVVAVSGGVLILTHTRTALLALVSGVLIAGLSMIVARSRVRRLFAIAATIAGIAILTLSTVLTNWLARGEGTKELTNLSGRTPVWNIILNLPRDRFQDIFGFGLSNASANGFAIDSNWLASYQELGLVGVVTCGAVLVFLLVDAYLQVRGVQRALALFLIAYCFIASFTEVGYTDASPYMLDLAVAASLLVPPIARDHGTRRTAGAGVYHDRAVADRVM
jgi:hypothetical protein